MSRPHRKFAGSYFEGVNRLSANTEGKKAELAEVDQKAMSVTGAQMETLVFFLQILAGVLSKAAVQSREEIHILAWGVKIIEEKHCDLTNL